MSNTFELICALVRQVPAGCVVTYGQVARWLGRPRLSHVVGYAMAACHDGSVPCHRVVNRLGGLSDAFVPLGRESQRLLLEMEGVPFRPDGTVDLDRALWSGPSA